jgi:hypothetical protein
MGSKLELNIEKLYSEHCSGISINALAKSYGISRDVIFRRFRSLGLETKTKLDLYNSKSAQIITLYLGKKSMNEISSILSIPLTQIWRVLKLHNVEVTEQYDYVDKYNKYHVEEYFDTIDTPNKAYFLGMLYADGNVNRKLNHVTLKLKASDIKILEDIKAAFSIESKLYFSKTKNPKAEDQYTLKIVNKKIRDNFIKHGVVPRKTWKLKFPFWLSEDLRSHFVRGYFDGDGCLYIDYKRSSASISICGTYQMCSDLEFLLKNSIGVASQISPDRNIFRTRIRRYSDVVAFCNWMYLDADLLLERKYNKYQEVRRLKDVGNIC